MLGDLAERFCGSHRMYRLDGGLLPHAECPMAETLRTGVPVRNEEAVFERTDGSRIVALVNIDAIRDDAGAIVGAVNCFSDITERRRIEDELRISRQDLEDSFENAAVGMHWVGADGTILRANRAELDLLGYAREEYVGRPIAEFHADRAAVDDILARLSRGETLDKYAADLRAKDGSIKHVLVSSSVLFRGGEFLHTRCVTLDVTADRRAEAAVRKSERRSRDLLEALPVAVYETDSEGRIVFYNRAAIELSGRTPELGTDRWCVSWRLHRPDGSPLPHDECPMSVALREDRGIRGAELIAERPDGVRIPCLAYPTPLHDESGALVGAVNTLVDIGARKQAEERQQLLLREMSHRINNLFALMGGLVTLSARFARTPEELARAIQDRLGALARAHDLIRPGRLVAAAQEAGQDATLNALIRAIFAPYLDAEPSTQGERVICAGPDLAIGRDAGATMALVLHELATNAAKYGALSTPSGLVRIDWSVADEELSLAWREEGGPALDGAPVHEGFGSTLARGSVTSQLGGRLSYDWNPSGVVVHLAVPLPRLAPSDS